MPNIEVGDYAKESHRELEKVNHDYDYPEGLDLKPGSKLHKKVLDFVMTRAIKSSAEMSNYYPKWNELDRTLTAYVDLTDGEKEVQEDDHRKPVSIVVPHSYAVLESTLGYMASAFFQEPIFRYEGTSPADTIGAILLTKVIDLHCNKTNVALNLHTMLRDNFVYSFGAVATDWEQKYGTRVMKRAIEKGGFFNPRRIVGYEKDVQEDALLFEGCRLQLLQTLMAVEKQPVGILLQSHKHGIEDTQHAFDL